MKILFLDVDGPLIPNRLYYGGIPQFENGIWRYDPVAVEIVKYLCQRYGVKIVYNSSHNNGGLEHMINQANANGFDAVHFHADMITDFPLRLNTRLGAIAKWLTYHPEVTKWAVFDDAIIDHVNAIQINFETGILIKDLLRAKLIFSDDEEEKARITAYLAGSNQKIWFD